MTSTGGRQKWLTVAEELATGFRVDAAERDRVGAEPVAEVAALRQSGVLGIDDWTTQQEVTRVVGAADANVGHLLGYHYLQIWRSGLFDNPAFDAGQDLFWAGVSNPLDAALELTPVDGGFTVSGRKTFATGASVADRLVVSATRADTGGKLTFTLDARSAGITYAGDWNNIGQRLTASGGVVFDAVFVPEANVLGGQDANTPRLSLAALGFQATLSQLYVALAEGALAEAARYTRATTRPWFLSGVDAATADPYILATYGELVADVEAAGLLADQACARLYTASETADLTAETRAAVAATISAAKVVSTKVANHTTTKVFELCGARATAAGYGFDRFWRNARTLTLHDPVAYKARELGAYHLTGEHAPFTGYS
ncbi:acyl-CoA dehydrogenase family protein [Actinosynnema sp. NPDC020468]|uniref:acyl-CoA dehydrogenase family protein n=1 Tax=Actinosynnema sp. NPDC020468 TaxID=3154488 RepID=UPI0033E0D3A7